MHEHERGHGAPTGRPIAVRRDAGRAERLAHGLARERGERPGRAAAQEFEEKGGRQEQRPGGPGDGNDEQDASDEAGEPGYFRLMHFTRRHPLNMLTFVTTSGISPTVASSGPRARFDFQPSRVQTGATRSSKCPDSRRSLRK